MGTRIVLTHRRRSKVVGTLRVPLYFYPYQRDLDGVGHYQERHTQCAYYFSLIQGPGIFPIASFVRADASGPLKTENHKNCRRARNWGWGPFLDFTSRKRQRRTTKIEGIVIKTLCVPFLTQVPGIFPIASFVRADASGSLKPKQNGWCRLKQQAHSVCCCISIRIGVYLRSFGVKMVFAFSTIRIHSRLRQILKNSTIW